MNQQETFEWPGWPLSENPFGEEFDAPARKRMVTGSQMLIPLLEKYRPEMGTNILEIGPFFNPLTTPKSFPNTEIFYWENDRHVIEHLNRQFKKLPAYCIYSDLNRIDGTSLLQLKEQTTKHFSSLGQAGGRFDVVVMSHLFNYTDYRLLLIILKAFIQPNALIFINNVVNYGLPNFFSEKRPLSIEETVESIKGTGYDVLESQIIPSTFPEHQKNPRLLLVAKNTN